MTAPQPSSLGPRRSQRGLHTSSPGSPKRAYVPDETEPILSGYTYKPTEVSPPELDPAAYTPLAPTPAVSDSIENYKPKTNLIAWSVAAVLLVLAIIGGIVLNNLPAATPKDPAPTTARPVPTATPNRSGGVPFSDKEVSGYWRILSAVWSDNSVLLTVEISVDTGTLFYDFYGWANLDGSQLEPTGNSPTDLRTGFIASGETVSGTLTFELVRQPMTLILSTRGQSQLSALQVDP